LRGWISAVASGSPRLFRISSGIQNAPKEFFATSEVRIGPGLRIASSIVFGFLINVAVYVCALIGVAMSGVPAVQGNFAWMLLSGLTSPFAPAFFIPVTLYFLRGGSLTLTKEGAQLTRRRKTVFCPWALFDVPGAPAKLDKRTVAIPVNPSAIADVKLLVNEMEIGNGRDGRTSQFRFRLDSSPRLANNGGLPEAALRDNYRARIDEVAALLFVIGCKMSRQFENAVKHTGLPE
jgi:hypothetical protein